MSSDSEISDSDLMIAKALLAKGNSVDAVANLLGVGKQGLQPIVDEANALADLKRGYEAGSPDETFGDWCASFLADDYPDNPLGLNQDKPYLSVSGLARRESWVKGPFKAATSAGTGGGRPRVDNSDDKLRAAANTAVAMAKNDRRINLKLAQIKAMAQHDVTDINGMTKVLQQLEPTLWKPRA